MDKNKLIEIIKNDTLNILRIESKDTSVTQDDRLIVSFSEINKFFEENNREPIGNIKDIHEYMLCERLKGIRIDTKKVNALLKYDKYKLLKKVNVEKSIKNIKDIFENDTMKILSDNENDIFKLKNVPIINQVSDEIAVRRSCKDFNKFEMLFKTLNELLSEGFKLSVPFTNEQQIKKGHFFILNGIVVYVADVGEKHSKGGKSNARLRCIFENGTESNMLLRSLATGLYKDKNGRRIIDSEENSVQLQKNEAANQETGYIYILKSLNTNSKVRLYDDLYKVGYTKIDISKRIKNASKDPTFLMAPVDIVATIKCYNLNPQKFEKLLHHFYSNACLDIEIIDSLGEKYVPREWFLVPLEEILLTIKLIMNDEIIHYKYDHLSKKVIPK